MVDGLSLYSSVSCLSWVIVELLNVVSQTMSYTESNQQTELWRTVATGSYLQIVAGLRLGREQLGEPLRGEIWELRLK